MKLDKLAVNAEAEEYGGWVQHPDFPDVWAKVRSPHSITYREAVRQENARLRREYGSTDVPVDVRDHSTAMLTVDHLLLDLRGLEDGDGNEYAYSRAFGEQLMTDRRYRKLADFVSWAAMQVGEQEAEADEADAGK